MKEWLKTFYVENLKFKKTKMKAKDISFLGIFLAIYLVMGFVPFLGFVMMPWGKAITFMHFLSAMLAYITWKRTGISYIYTSIIAGTMFGLLSLFQSGVMGQGQVYIYGNPLYSVFPRVLFGVAIIPFVKLADKKWWLIPVMMFMATILNAVFVLGVQAIIPPKNIVGIAKTIHWVVMGTHVVPEAACALVIGTPVLVAFIKIHNPSFRFGKEQKSRYSVDESMI